MTESMVEVGARLLAGCMALTPKETLLVVTDKGTREVGEALFEGGRPPGREVHPDGDPTHGAARSRTAARCGRGHEASRRGRVPDSVLTHPQARLEAARAGVRIATMPGITQEMFFAGAVSADYEAVAASSRRLADLLTQASEARIVKAGKELILPIKGRTAVASTGLYRERGQSGNLPSGEAYIAPVEGLGRGETIIDGSLAGIGKLAAPVLVRIEGGRLTSAEGSAAARLLQLLDESPDGRNVGELGVGTNDRARLSGVVSEDEKVYGTVHIAFGDNSTFGGNTRAGVHINGIILTPDLYLDGHLVVSRGKLLV